MLRLGKATPDEIELLLDAARRADLTYPVPGATRDLGKVPSGYRVDASECRLGGPATFDGARGGLQTWQAHIGAGTSVVSGDLAPGETVLVLAGFGPLQVVAPCRVVYVVDEPDSFGFAYGTLPGHPEEGEEAFVIERRGNGSTVFRISSFSRPADRLTKLMGPAGRFAQLQMTRRYERAMQRWVESAA